MAYPQILFKTFLKLKVTTIILVAREHFPQEILKQIWITDNFLHGSKKLGPCTGRDETSYYSE